LNLPISCYDEKRVVFGFARIALTRRRVRARVTLVPRHGEHDRRVALGRELLDLARVEEQQALAVAGRSPRTGSMLIGA
jgi:hypothetical protein